MISNEQNHSKDKITQIFNEKYGEIFNVKNIKENSYDSLGNCDYIIYLNSSRSFSLDSCKKISIISAIELCKMNVFLKEKVIINLSGINSCDCNYNWRIDTKKCAIIDTFMTYTQTNYNHIINNLSDTTNSEARALKRMLKRLHCDN